MMFLETERLVLLPMQAYHFGDIFALHNDRLVQQTVFDNVPQTQDDVRAKLDLFLSQWRKNGFGFWVVYEKTANGLVFIGRAGMRDYEDTNNLEFGYVYSEYGSGRGLGPEAAYVTMEHALQNSAAEKVVGVITPGNSRAMGAVKKLGLRYIDDRWHDEKFWHYFEMTREEFFEQQEARKLRAAAKALYAMPASDVVNAMAAQAHSLVGNTAMGSGGAMAMKP